jgi:phenylacetate-CoA ligase
MRLINRIYASTVLPWRDPLGYAGLSARLDKYQKMEGRTLAQNLEHQWEALQRMCIHAYETTPFYKHRFDSANVDPRALRSPADLKRLPVLTRRDIELNLDELWSRKYERSELREAATGGTTTTPVKLLRDPGVLLERNAVQASMNAWAGMFPGDKVFYLWGAMQDYAQAPSWKHELYERHVMRRVWAQTTLSNDGINREQLHLLNGFRPDVIYAYPTPLANLCEWIVRMGVRRHRPRAIICTAEALRPEQREVMQQAFEAPVFEHYGTRDFGMVGAECEAHSGLHIHPAAVYFEMSDLGSDDTGIQEIFVTDLLNHGMPMIRYQIGDCVLPAEAPCPCGRGFPLVRTFLGRTTDNFYLADGSIVRGVSIPRMIAGVSRGVRQVQVVQNAVDEFEFRYVPGEEFQASDLELMRHEGHIYFGKQANIVLREVDSIPRERSGKTRLCICRLTPEEKQGLLARTTAHNGSRSITD